MEETIYFYCPNSVRGSGNPVGSDEGDYGYSYISG